MEEKNKMTKEEALRRWESSKRKKQEHVEAIIKYMTDAYHKRTGKYPSGVEVW
ncbi:MAG: protein tyrosine phosphatase [Bacteroidales bacterium]|nr:protein tyrosine phosphatase [Bacteroidales bacterium]